MFRKFGVTSLVFVLMVVIWQPALPEEGGCVDQSYSIDAFGGEFRVPNYMRLVVNTRSERLEEARMIRKIDETGSVRLIAIQRNDEDEYDRRVGSTLKLIDEYEINDFDVQIYQSSDPDIPRGLYSTVIERGGDKAHVIVDSLKALDDLLTNAEKLDAEIVD